LALPYQKHQKLNKQQGQQSLSFNQNADVFGDFYNKPFWIWNRRAHLKLAKETGEHCCFNHIIGLPVKNGQEFPIFDFQKQIYDFLEEYQNIWIKKARSIGVTTFLIRYLVWKVLYSDELDGKSIFIISGTREEFANYVKKKMEDLFLQRYPNVQLESKYTELWIKKTWIKVMPTRNIKGVRGYMDAAYLFIDEADYFDKQVQQELEPAIMAYEEKSKGKTIMVSTPQRPGGLFERIEKDRNSKYMKLFLDYTYGLDTIYDPACIAKKKLDPDFPREYDLQYLGVIGNTFHTQDIDRAIALGKKFKTVNKYAQQSMGIDPGFGSSPFGIVIVQFSDGVLQVLYADEFERPRYEDMITKVADLYQEFTNIKNIFVDAANPELISSLKREVANERDNWAYVQEKMAYCKKHHTDINRHMKVVPVPFSSEGKNMLIHTKELLEFETPIVAINPKFEKLTTSLRTAISDDLGKLDKEATSYDNVLDAFRLSLQMFKLKDKESDTVLYATID
jgi:hypothetical protein